MYYQNKIGKTWVEPRFVPQCLPSHPRTCTIKHFNGCQSDLTLAKYILKNSNIIFYTYILEWWSETIHMSWQNEMHKKSDMWQFKS